MEGDGNGWTIGPSGTRVWGRHGAAGLMLVALDTQQVLMQHRAVWTNQGGTWALPGGARDSHESEVDAALREAHEETGIDTSLVEIVSAHVTSGPFESGWTYTTVIAKTTTGEPIATVANEESLELRWVDLSKVTDLPLHNGFEQSYPFLHATILEMHKGLP